MFGLHRALLFTSVVCGAAQLEGVPRILLVDGKPSPHLGIEPRPSVSWAPPAAQLAYQIQVASVASSDPNFDEASLVPGSDKTIADRHSTLIKWHGDSLAPASAYWLRVRTWSKVDDASSGWSSPAKLVTGLHDGFAPGTKPIWTSAADRYGFLRTSFTPHGPIAHAHAFVTAPQEGADAKLLGAYRLFLNGVVAGTGPGRGDAAVHTPYDTVDLTSQLAAGGGDVVLALQGYHTNATCRVMFELHVLYSDGSVAVLGTSSGWDAWGADRLFNPTGDTGGDFHTQPRENIDARAIATGGGTGADMTAWRRAGFVPSQAAGWAAAEEQPPIPPPVLAKPTQPLHVVGGVAPRSVVASEVAGGSKGGSWLADFGSELMGGASLRVRGAREGDTVLLEMGEELSGSTTVLEPMRTKNNYSMVWTLAEGDNTLEQHEYFLFRWAQLTLSGARAAEAGVEGGSSAPPFELTAWVVAYPFDDAAAYFESSNSTLNAVWSLCKNTIRVTSLDTATDSNTRERRPYEADALVTAQSFYALSTDLVWPRHTARYLLTNPTWPTEWRQSMALLALEDFMASGEPSLAVAAADLDGLLVASQRGCIDRSSGLVDFTSCSRQGGAQRDVIDWPQPSRDGYILSNVSSCVNAYAVGALAALGRLAEATGRPELAAQLTNQSLATAAAMRAKLVSSETGLFVDGASGAAAAHTAIHSCIYPLAFGVAGGDAALEARCFGKIETQLRAAWSAGTAYNLSVFAAAYLLKAVYAHDADHGALALDVLASCGHDSWCHMILEGATATMEAWTRDEKPNLSWSHPWGTAPTAAIVRGLMGVTATSPAFETFDVKPQPGGLRWASLRLPTARGALTASFNQTAALGAAPASFALRLGVPADAQATACLPRLGAKDDTLELDGVPVKGRAQGDYLCVGGVGSGKRVVVRRASPSASP